MKKLIVGSLSFLLIAASSYAANPTRSGAALSCQIQPGPYVGYRHKNYVEKFVTIHARGAQVAASVYSVVKNGRGSPITENLPIMKIERSTPNYLLASARDNDYSKSVIAMVQLKAQQAGQWFGAVHFDGTSYKVLCKLTFRK